MLLTLVMIALRSETCLEALGGGFYQRSGAEWKRDQDSASAPTSTQTLSQWQKGPGQRKRPHPASTQPLSLREGYLAPERW